MKAQSTVGETGVHDRRGKKGIGGTERAKVQGHHNSGGGGKNGSTVLHILLRRAKKETRKTATQLIKGKMHERGEISA